MGKSVRKILTEMTLAKYRDNIMKDYAISINQFAEFKYATDGQKRTIIKQQINPNKLKIAWYQLPKSRVKNCLKNKCDLETIQEGINILSNRKFSEKRKESNRVVSLEALQRFININMPDILKKYDFSIIKPIKKSTFLSGIDITVAPDLIVTGIINGEKVVGGIKIHIVKNKPFDIIQSKIVANVLAKYLKQEIADESTIVLPELCFCIDIFNGNFVQAKASKFIDKQIEEICLEVKKTWDKLLAA